MWKSVIAICVGASLARCCAGGSARSSIASSRRFPQDPGRQPRWRLCRRGRDRVLRLVHGHSLGVAVARHYGVLRRLTTFSTFSAEIVTLLQQGRALWACGAAAVHLCGSILMTLAGIGPSSGSGAEAIGRQRAMQGSLCLSTSTRTIDTTAASCGSAPRAGQSAGHPRRLGVPAMAGSVAITCCTRITFFELAVR